MKVLPVHAPRALISGSWSSSSDGLPGGAELTGLTGPFIDGRRSSFVDGIEVIIQISYSNHAGLFERAVVFFATAKSLQHFVLTRIWFALPPLTAGIPGIAARWLLGTPFVFEVRDLWPLLPRAWAC